MQGRFDKLGRRLPDTGRGCGCQLCADAGTPGYERRRDPERTTPWNALRRRLALALARILRRPQAA